MQARWQGVFFLDDEQRVPGELTVDDRDGRAEVTLWDIGTFGDAPQDLASRTLHGVIWKGASTALVSAFGCRVSGGSYASTGPMYRADIVFSSVALGNRLVRRDEPIVTAAAFLFEGFERSHPMRSGFDAVIEPDAELKAQVERSMSAERSKRFKLGDNPVIGFFDGSGSDLTITGTPLGDIEVNARSVTIPSGEPLVKRGPFVRLRFEEAISLSAAHERLSAIRSFVGLVTGCVPRLTEFSAEATTPGDSPPSFDVIAPTDRLDAGRTREPSIGMSLLNHVARQDEFKDVTRNWLDRNQDSHRFDSNSRFLRHFGNNSYNEDRLIGAVNMFDLLPPSEKRYTNGKEIKDIASVIKKKAGPILDALGPDALPRLDYVVDCAVNGRNHYTHGTPAKVNFRAGGTLVFLTSAMEFIHGVSEMLVCGWDLAAWVRQDRGGRHPFGSFLRDYSRSLTQLDASQRSEIAQH
ncbi:MAG: hypothetical protein F4Y04_06160 [Chloroflexi bacterium]|nr:hypothetical protein [Chloroflexota bacterium]